jgi:signal transduction histidine kinase/ligand-binding sensor domain-containing protein
MARILPFALRSAFLACAGLALCSLAQETTPSLERKPFHIKYFTTEDNLPQNQISCLKQTRDGYLWAGTYFGLARFNGVEFTKFNHFNTPELPEDTINALTEDSEGTLWIGTSEGLASYREHQFQKVALEKSVQGEPVWHLASSPSGGIWLHVGNRVMKFSQGHFSAALQTEEVEHHYISLAEGADGWVNIFTPRQWLALSPDGREARTNAVSQPEAADWIASLPAPKPGSRWLGTTEGMYYCDPKDVRSLAATELEGKVVDRLFQDRSGNVWANVRGESFGQCVGGHFKQIDLGEGVGNGPALCFEEDREGSIWVGTHDGLVQLCKPLVTAYTKHDGLSHDKIWSVCEGADRTIWVGAENGLNCIHPNGRPESLPAAGPTAKYSDRCLWPRRGGGVWTARSGAGLFGFQDGRFIQATLPSFAPTPVTFLWGNGAGLLFVGTEENVAVFRETDPPPWREPIASYQVRGAHSMLEDRDGTLWFGTYDQGLACLRQGKFSFFNQKRSGLSGDSVWSIHADGDGSLWFGTDNGLTRYKGGNFFAFTSQHGLPETTINCLLEDDFGYFWLSGLHGVYRVKRAELNDIADGHVHTIHLFVLGTADGMESAESNGEKQPAGWKASNGCLWFPTIRGVVAIDPQAVPLNEAPPPVVIEKIRADDEVLPNNAPREDSPGWSKTSGSGSTFNSSPSTRKFHVSPGHGHALEFQYSANSFVDPKRVRYRYRLVGAHSDWRVTSERIAHYSNLRPGNYQFEVVAANHHNVWNTQPASFAFFLAPYFWQTTPFYVLCAGVIVGLGIGLQTYRARWRHRLLKLEQQRALDAERARIARDLHDDLGTALTGLALELDVVGRDTKDGPPLTHRLGRAAQYTRDLAERMREVVWSINPRCDTVASLASFLEQQVSQFLRSDAIRLHLDFPEDIPDLPLGAEARHQLALSIREALTNVVRHARATRVIFSLRISGESLVLEIKDDGRGLQNGERKGNGLTNMRERLEQVGGSFDCVSAQGSGTTITLRVPLPKPDGS